VVVAREQPTALAANAAHVAIGARDRSLRLLDLGSPSALLLQHARRIRARAFARRPASGGGRKRHASRGRRRLRRDRVKLDSSPAVPFGEARALSFSPDGKMLGLAAREETFFFDAARGSLLGRTKGGGAVGFGGDAIAVSNGHEVSLLAPTLASARTLASKDEVSALAFLNGGQARGGSQWRESTCGTSRPRAPAWCSRLRRRRARARVGRQGALRDVTRCRRVLAHRQHSSLRDHQGERARAGRPVAAPLDRRGRKRRRAAPAGSRARRHNPIVLEKDATFVRLPSGEIEPLGRRRAEDSDL
jgi:hypothetical protein